MQQRRYRPGDVLDDYCPRERRITDHAIVAMIDDRIKQTRCVVCDAEHEYKDGKMPARRKKPQAALFTQVLEGLQGPQPAARLAAPVEAEAEPPVEMLPPQDAGTSDVTEETPVALPAPAAPPPAAARPAAAAAPAALATADPEASEREPAHEDRPWRRQLIRAALPRPEGTPAAPPRPLPEFTARQPNNTRGRRSRRRGGHQPHAGGVQGPMRFGRDAHGAGNQRPHNGRSRRRGKKR